MPLETGTTINDLVSTNPAATDGLGQADDHVRLVKTVLKTTFPAFVGVLASSEAEIDASVALTQGIPWDTAQIADDAITYAKMQNVSATDMVLGRSTAGAGDVEEIACTAAGRALLDDANAAAQRTTLGLATVAATGAYSDLSGLPTLGTAAAIDVGTSANQIVRLNASAQIPAVSGALLTNLPNDNVIKISTNTLGSAAADMQFLTLSSTYREFVFALDGVVPATDGATLVMEVSDDGGSTWETTSYVSAYHDASGTTSDAALSGGTASFLLAGSVDDGTTNFGAFGEVRLVHPEFTTRSKFVRYSLGWLSSGGAAWIDRRGSGVWTGSTAVNAVRFRFSTGNINGGSITLYGIK